mgnify:CR=1 FL=1
MQSHSPDRIAQLAYQLWQERGCPEGSPEVDWERATRMLEQGQTQTGDDNEVLASTIARVPAEASPAGAGRSGDQAPVAQPVPPVLQPVSKGGAVRAASSGGTDADPSAVIAQSKTRGKGRNARRSAI